MPSLVLFAYHFPPDTAIGAARPYRFYKYLRRLGYRVHVITASPQTQSAQEDVEYIPDPFFTPNHDLGWQAERAIRKFLLPGVLGLRWAHAAAEAGERFLKEQLLHEPGPAAILATSPPFGTHYAAWRLARATKLPWIADFRDPLGGVSLSIDGVGALQKPLFNALETKIIQSANLVIANTDSMEEFWKQKHPREASKIHLLWNGFDPEALISPKELPARKYKVLSHVGELYAGRTVAPVLESIGRLVARGEADARGLRVRIIGPAKASALPDPEFLAWGQSQGWLDVSTQPVNQKEAREIAQTSDGLLLIQPQSAVQVPGKLYEYLQIGRPILAFVLPDSPVERILSQSGIPYRCVYAGSYPEEMDETVVGFLRLPSDAVRASDWFQENFGAENQADMLSKMIESIGSGPAS